MRIKAHAKLNFYLEILGQRSDGYHNLRSIMQQIHLHDVVMFDHSPNDRFVMRQRPMHSTNLVLRAVRALRRQTTFPGVSIELSKQIPIGAGLGGGSSDAAATLVGLNRFFGLGLSVQDLCEIGASLGSDVPFFIACTAGLVEGTGTQISCLSPIDLPYILLARPKGKLSTASVYSHLEPADYQTEGSFDLFFDFWNNGQLGTTFNHLEHPAFSLDARVRHLKTTMLATNPSHCLMTGSGNVVFAVYRSQAELDQARRVIADQAAWTWATASLKE